MLLLLLHEHKRRQKTLLNQLPFQIVDFFLTIEILMNYGILKALRSRRTKESSQSIELVYSGTLFNELSLALLSYSYTRVYSRHGQQGCNINLERAKRKKGLSFDQKGTKMLVFRQFLWAKGAKIASNLGLGYTPYTAVLLHCTVYKFKICSTYFLTM